MRHPDLWGAFVIFIVGCIAIAAALTTPDPGFGVVGPGVFAVYLGVAVLASSMWLGWDAVRARTIPALDPIEWRPLVRSIVATALYLAVFVPVGFVLASVLYFFAEARILGSTRPVRDAIVSTLFVGALDVVFVRLLGVQLPRGVLGL